MRNGTGQLYASIPPSTVATPFNVFIFVVSDDVVARDFASNPPMYRRYSQERLCSPQGDPCFVVSNALHVTASEFLDRSLISLLLAVTVGFREPPPVSTNSSIMWSPIRPSTDRSPTAIVVEPPAPAQVTPSPNRGSDP